MARIGSGQVRPHSDSPSSKDLPHGHEEAQGEREEERFYGEGEKGGANNLHLTENRSILCTQGFWNFMKLSGKILK